MTAPTCAKRTAERRGGARQLAFALGLWAALTQPLLLVLHNSVEHTHSHPRLDRSADIIPVASPGADHDHPRPGAPADQRQDWCPTLQTLKAIGLYLPSIAPLVLGPADYSQPVLPASTIERQRSVYFYDSPARAPPSA